MNPNFRFGRVNRLTLLSISRAIAPIEIGVEALDIHVLEQIEAQVRQFPRLHRLGFCLGLYFIEFGAFLGGWGLLPFSMLKRKRATKRLYRLLHSRITPVRLLVNGLRVLVCLSAYGHTEVERWFGFERRAWRKQRIATRQALLKQLHHPQAADSLAPVPEPLFNLQDQKHVNLLSWESHQAIDYSAQHFDTFSEMDAQTLSRESIVESPFRIEGYLEKNSPKEQKDTQVNEG